MARCLLVRVCSGARVPDWGPGGRNVSKFVVTGGCGFIGRHLVSSLLADGHLVTIVDDLSNSSAANLPAGVTVTVGDVADHALMREVLDDAAGCFHLAAIASVAECEADWARSHRVNAGGTVSVLNAARATDGRGAIPVVFASSAAIYGNQHSVPIRESTPPAPQSVYGADKLAGEINGAVSVNSFGVPFTALRFFNVYGPGQNPSSPYSGVISRFVSQALSGSELTIFGDGSQTRDFVYVADVVRHLKRAMETSSDQPRIFNVCSGQETSISHLAETVVRLAGGSARIARAPARGFDILRSLGHNGAAMSALALKAETDLRSGLANVLRGLAESHIPALESGEVGR